GHACLFALDAFGNRRRRVYRGRWHAVDALFRPITRRDAHAGGFAAAVGAGDGDVHRAFLVAAAAEHHAAVAGGAQRAPGVFDLAAGWHLADHHRALLHAGGEHDAAVVARLRVDAGGGAA